MFGGDLACGALGGVEACDVGFDFAWGVFPVVGADELATGEVEGVFESDEQCAGAGSASTFEHGEGAFGAADALGEGLEGQATGAAGGADDLAAG